MSPILSKALIDSGSNISDISAKFIRQLGGVFVREEMTESINGEVTLRLFRMSLHLYDSSDVNIAWFPHPSLLVMELREDLEHEVLLGTDILFDCIFTLDGSARQFSLDF